MEYLKNTLRKFLLIGHIGPPGLKYELMRFWRSKVNVSVTSHIVNAIAQERVEGVSLDLAQMSTSTQGKLITFWRAKVKATVTSNLVRTKF